MIQLLLQSTPRWEVNWFEVLTIGCAVFGVDKTPIDEIAGKQLRNINVHADSNEVIWYHRACKGFSTKVRQLNYQF